MNAQERLEVYRKQNGGEMLTPKQVRRWTQKMLREERKRWQAKNEA